VTQRASEPALSVILPVQSRETVETTLAHLRAQTAVGRLELVLVPESDRELGLQPATLDAFCRVQVVATGPVERLSQALTAGVRAATAPVVVMAEDHSFPEPRWAEALIRRHEEPCVAVGPAMVCANPESLLGWADLLISFGRWVDREEALEMDALPSHNCSYKRDALLACGPALEDLMEIERLLQAHLRARGGRLCLEPAARTRHVNITRPSSWISNRFLGGWVFAALRSSSWPIWRRVLYVAGSPALPGRAPLAERPRPAAGRPASSSRPAAPPGARGRTRTRERGRGARLRAGHPRPGP
jgi:hypothetical protein